MNIGQVVKRRSTRGLSIERRLVQGQTQQVEACLKTSQGGGQINIAFVERLNATFRQRLACLGQRSRSPACKVQPLEAGTFLVGCVYSFCTHHDNLKQPLWMTKRRCHWVHFIPAMVARLTDHQWSVLELLTFKVPPPPFVPPKRHGRPPKAILQEAIP